MQEISVEELKKRMDAGESLHIIDVREPDEYAAFNIGGILVPLGKIMGMQLDELEDWKDDELIIHCHAGKRSMQACMMLETAGFTNVKNVTGGMVAWQDMMNKG
ncbi:MAG: rhodanese-like domain-containing protein [Bacteroidetes bacterium]|nr:rhodanese-like domain-containing protein [Bacteroidota bacterium]